MSISKNINTKMKNYPTEDCVWMGVFQLSLKLKNFFKVLVFRKSCGTEYLFGFKTNWKNKIILLKLTH